MFLSFLLIDCRAIIFHLLWICFQFYSWVAEWLGRRISDQGVPSSNSGRCTFGCGLEQVTFTLLSTGWNQEAVYGRLTWTDCDEAGDYVVPNVLSPRDLVFRPDNMDETFMSLNADLHNLKFKYSFLVYRKVPKFSDTRKLCCNLPKIQTKNPKLRVY